MGSQPLDKSVLDAIVVGNANQQESGGSGIAPGVLPDHENSDGHDNQVVEQGLQKQDNASAGPTLQLLDSAADDSRIGEDGTVQSQPPPGVFSTL